jgi:hypothetical protein
MGSKWAFIGGILAGIAGVFTVAAVSVELENRNDGRCNADEEPKRLALPERRREAGSID